MAILPYFIFITEFIVRSFFNTFTRLLVIVNIIYRFVAWRSTEATLTVRVIRDLTTGNCREVASINTRSWQQEADESPTNGF